MTNISKLLRLDFKIFKNYYKTYMFMILFMLFVFGNMTFNMGVMILVCYYGWDNDENYIKINKLAQTLPINNKEYIYYKYVSAFIQLIFIIMVFILASIIIIIAEKISVLDSDIFLLSWLSNHIVKGNGIEVNYFIRFVAELFMAVVTICVMIPTKYNKIKKKRVLTWLLLIYFNSMVGSFLTKDYTWILIDFLSKFNELFMVILAFVLSYIFIKLSFNKALQLHTKSEIG